MLINNINIDWKYCEMYQSGKAMHDNHVVNNIPNFFRTDKRVKMTGMNSHTNDKTFSCRYFINEIFL